MSIDSTQQKCSFCGAGMKKPWHRLTPGLVHTLVKVYVAVSQKGENKVRMKELTLSHSEYGNFQKLRFHALIAKCKENGVLKKGYWVMTRRGADFLKGKASIPAKVQTFRNKVVDHDEQLVDVKDVIKSEPYWQSDFDFDIEPMGLPIQFNGDGQGILI